MGNLPRKDGAGKRSFTLHLSADVLKTLSPKEERLWTALLRIRDAATGELRFGDRWFDGKRFDREAKMSPRTRQPVMRSLVDKGLVNMEPVYANRVIADRLTGHRRNRKVRTGFHYFVAESPREDWLSTKRQDETPHKQRPSTKRQKEKDSTKRQSLPSARFAAAKTSPSLLGGQRVSGSGFDSGLQEQEKYPLTSSSSSPQNQTDDDDAIYRTLSKERPHLLHLLTLVVLNRAREMGKTVVSPERYLRAALPTLLKEDLSTEMTILRYEKPDAYALAYEEEKAIKQKEAALEQQGIALARMIDWISQETERQPSDWPYSDDFAKAFVLKSIELRLPYPADLARFAPPPETGAPPASTG